jgi:hypothetical protein
MAMVTSRSGSASWRASAWRPRMRRVRRAASTARASADAGGHGGPSRNRDAARRRPRRSWLITSRRATRRTDCSRDVVLASPTPARGRAQERLLRDVLGLVEAAG